MAGLRSFAGAWREAVEVNLMGVVHGVQAAWPRLVRALSRREYAKLRPLLGKE